MSQRQQNAYKLHNRTFQSIMIKKLVNGENKLYTLHNYKLKLIQNIQILFKYHLCCKSAYDRWTFSCLSIAGTLVFQNCNILAVIDGIANNVLNKSSQKLRKSALCSNITFTTAFHIPRVQKVREKTLLNQAFSARYFNFK